MQQLQVKAATPSRALPLQHCRRVYAPPPWHRRPGSGHGSGRREQLLGRPPDLSWQAGQLEGAHHDQLKLNCRVKKLKFFYSFIYSFECLAAAPTLLCSATSQDSKAEKSSEVATPHSTRPPASTQKLLKCLVRQPRV